MPGAPNPWIKPEAGVQGELIFPVVEFFACVIAQMGG
jgi:hypothetical protein